MTTTKIPSARARELVEKAACLGWRYEGRTRGGHVLMVHLSGRKFVASATPSDHRAVLNGLSIMKRIVREEESKKCL